MHITLLYLCHKILFENKNSCGSKVNSFLCTRITLIWMTSGLEVMWQLHWKQLSFWSCLDKSPLGWVGVAVWLDPIGNLVKELSCFWDCLNFSCGPKTKEVNETNHLITAVNFHGLHLIHVGPRIQKCREIVEGLYKCIPSLFFLKNSMWAVFICNIRR